MNSSASSVSKGAKLMEMTKPIAGAPNFTLKELCKSETAEHMGIDNSPESDYIKQNLIYLAQKVLQPIRDQFGPIIVHSGYRCKKLNDAVGSSDSSFHRYGMAADIDLPIGSDGELMDVMQFIIDKLPYTELISEEFPGGWIHVAIANGRENEKALKLKLRGSKVKRVTYEELLNELE